jgi:hypothetical protein
MLRRDPRQSELRLTTHLVLPSLDPSHLDGTVNRKIDVVVQRFMDTKRAECRVVGAEWVVASAKAGRWIDSTPYDIPIKRIVAAHFAAALQRTAAVAPEGQKRVAVEAAVDAVPLDGRASVPHVVETAEPLAPDATATPRDTQIILSLEALVSKLEDQAQRTARSPLLTDCPPPPTRSLWDVPNCTGISFGDAQSLRAVVRATVPEQQESQVVYYRHSQECGVSSPPQLVRPLAVGCPAPPSRLFFLAKSVQEADAARIIEALGGKLAATVEACTHFIVPKPAKTETFLRCVAAAGKWVLAPSYLTRCAAAGRFVAEEPDEWAAPALVSNAAASSLADACQLQRKAAVRVFVQWKAALCCQEPARAQSFARVLEAGGCASVCVLSAEKLAGREGRQAVRGRTHLLCDDGCLGQDVLEALVAETGITAHRMELLVHVLCTTTPVPENFTALGWLVARKRARELEGEAA